VDAETKTRKTVGRRSNGCASSLFELTFGCLFAPLTWVQGAKIRSTYVKWAQGEKKRLEDELERKKGEVKGKEAEVQQARGE